MAQVARSQVLGVRLGMLKYNSENLSLHPMGEGPGLGEI